MRRKLNKPVVFYYMVFYIDYLISAYSVGHWDSRPSRLPPAPPPRGLALGLFRVTVSALSGVLSERAFKASGDETLWVNGPRALRAEVHLGPFESFRDADGVFGGQRSGVRASARTQLVFGRTA